MKITVSGDLTFTIEKDSTSPGRIFFAITKDGVTTKSVTMLILPNDCYVKASITPVDSQGNPAQIDGIAAWSSSNPAIASLQNVSPDGLSAEIYPAGTLGDCQINVTADADLGAGTQTISGLLDVTVEAGTAVGFQIQTGPVTPIPPT